MCILKGQWQGPGNQQEPQPPLLQSQQNPRRFLVSGELRPLPASDRTFPGVVTATGPGLQDFDHSCFAMLKNHRKTTEATEREISELEERREPDPAPPAAYEPATSSTIISATGNLPGERSREQLG